MNIIRLKQVDHIKNEKNILLEINHPFIVTLYTCFQDIEYIYMVMEYVIGGELFTQIRNSGHFNNKVTRFYATEILLALAYLHSKDIVYRDLKPENILIDSKGHIKLTDFGFSKKIIGRTWTLCGTAEYLAPELIQSKGHSKPVDWWAFGILIFEMLAGYPPFYDENPLGIYQKVLGGLIEFPSYFDPYARDLVKKLLTADTTRRYGCMRDGPIDILKHKWFHTVNWKNVITRSVPPPFIPTIKSENDTSNFIAQDDLASEESLSPEIDQSLFDNF